MSCRIFMYRGRTMLAAETANRVKLKLKIHLEDFLNSTNNFYNLQKPFSIFNEKYFSQSFSSIFIHKSSIAVTSRRQVVEIPLSSTFHNSTLVESREGNSRSLRTFRLDFRLAVSHISEIFTKSRTLSRVSARNGTESKKSISGWKKGWLLVGREKFFWRVAKKV